MYTETISPTNRVIRGLSVSFFVILGMLFISLISSQPAYAALCQGPDGKLTVCDGAVPPGGGINPDPGTQPAPGNPGAGTNPPGGNGGGGGGGGGFGRETVWSPYSLTSICPIRDDGKANIGFYSHYQRVWEMVDGENPPPGSGWEFVTRTNIMGNMTTTWTQRIFLNFECVYPPRTQILPLDCYISTTAQVRMVAPASRVVGQQTSYSGYGENSGNYNACVNSKTSIKFGQGFDAYGFYNIGTFSRVQRVLVEYTLEPHPLTGAMAPPRIVSTAGAYNGALVVAGTASVHCTNGFKSPGTMYSDWSDTPCNNISYVCPYVNPQIDVSDIGKSKSMKSFSGKIQLVRDGKNRETVFGLGNVRGTSISVSSYQTKFTRSGTPWDNSKSYTKNLFEMSTNSSSSGSILSVSSGSSTNLMNGKINNIFTRGYYASEAGSPTKVTQEVTWKGTRSVRSGFINTVNPVTGSVSYGSRYITVPTSGKCSQSASLDYVRSIGHEAG